MSEEQIKIWKKVEAKGLEKLGNIEKALLAKEGFKEAHKDYCDFINRLAETTGLTSGELDRHFTTLLAEKKKQRTEIPIILLSLCLSIPAAVCLSYWT